MADYDPDSDLAQASGPPKPDSPDDSKDDSAESFLAPKSAFYGKDLQPGSTETVKVKAVFEDEVELECVKKGKDDTESHPEDAAEPVGAEMMEADA